MHQRASNAAAANDLLHGARWCGRIHIRFEAPQDLIADLAQGPEKIKTAAWHKDDVGVTHADNG